MNFGILFGIFAMLGWGLGDFFTKKLTERVSAYHATLYRTFVSIMILLPASLVFAGTIFTSKSSTIVLLVTGFIGFIAYIFYVKGIKVGNVSVISPIAHSSVIITVLLSVFFLKETISLLQITAIILIIAGVIFVSFKYSDFKNSRKLINGLGFALIAFVGWGLLFFLWKIPLSDTSPFVVSFYLEMLVFAFAFIFAFPLRKKMLVKFDKKIILYSALVGAIIAAASLCYTFGLNLEYVSLVAPIAASSPLAAIVLSRIFLKEKLEWNQKTAVAMILIGLVLISL